MEKKLEELATVSRSEDVDLLQWKAYVEETESEIGMKEGEKRQFYKLILVLDELHEAYVKPLKESEEKWVRIYDAYSGDGDGAVELEKEDMVSEEVVENFLKVMGKEMANVGFFWKAVEGVA